MYHTSPSFGWSDRTVSVARAHAIALVHAHEAALADHDLFQNAREAVTATNRCCYSAVATPDAAESQKPSNSVGDNRDSADHDDDHDDDDDDDDDDANNYDYGGGGGSTPKASIRAQRMRVNDIHGDDDHHDDYEDDDDAEDDED